MARVIVNTQNALFADMLKSTLEKGGDFIVYTVKKPDEVVSEFRHRAAEIILLEVTANSPWKLDERMKVRDALKKTDPDCKIVMLVDENIEKKIADDVTDAKVLGKIDQFIFSSVSATYLVALMNTL